MFRTRKGSIWAPLAAVIGLAAILAAPAALRTVIQKSPAPKAKVLLFLSTDCPVAARYAPRIQELEATYAPQGVQFEALFPNEMETAQGARHYCSDRGYRFEPAIDLGAQKARAYGIDVVPTVVILDENGRKIYVGGIDDNRDPALVKKRYVAENLDAVLAGRSAKYKVGEPFGCVLMPGKKVVDAKKVDYARHVKPIVDRSCVPCHRSGEVAPFSLAGYENARKWSPMIAKVTADRRMPPWKAVHGYNEFADENRLTEQEIQLLSDWDKAGAPRGDAKIELPTPTFPSTDWPIGEPDLILSPKTAFKLAADGSDEYRHFVLKTNFSETKWVKAMAVKPGNKQVVHHVIAFLDERGQSHRLDGKDGQEGYSTFGGPGIVPDGSLGGWAPGLNTQMTPEGMAFELKPGTTVIMEVHYHRTGKPESDTTKLGLYFAKEPIKKAMSLAWLANPRIRIQAGDAASKHEVVFPVPADITTYNAMPHMHLLGKSMRADVEFPDGAIRPLIFVDDWDFNWQMSYAFREPMRIPKGSKVRVRATFDNSERNPNNPSSPPKVVRWGEQTTDEMMLLIVSYTVDAAMRPSKTFMGFGGAEGTGGLEKLLERLRAGKKNPNSGK